MLRVLHPQALPAAAVGNERLHLTHFILEQLCLSAFAVLVDAPPPPRI